MKAVRADRDRRAGAGRRSASCDLRARLLPGAGHQGGRRDLAASYSCREGVCGACACRLTGGEVEMAHNEVLEDEGLADGYVLACQSVALTPEVSVSYD
ncbi:MAG TPA: 2Fe-2S iron-sulfur cluster binding domain-containing protein [Streptosporangiaceae bacterium]|nr:2Fe-2S iron-sulfur cluster binding domain-containing protein [Streptosporangiaceae bacterium]